MIPLKLELKNFMAYRDGQTLDLNGLHVVCLSGENGAGKSTLLDAVTWALWGQARARRDDELISQGETEMRVSLIFTEGKNRYQVVRSRKMGRATARAKAPASSGTLELLIDDNGSWRTISENRQSETQAKIEKLLNLTYDTFVNSAYLKQGRADEFTLKTPAERKSILAEILSLEVWSWYEEKVKLRQGELERSLELLSYELKTAENEIARLPIYEQELSIAQAQSEVASLALQEADEQAAEMDRTRERMRTLRVQHSQTESRVKNLLGEIDSTNDERARHQTTLAEYQAALSQRDQIEQGVAEYQQAMNLNEQFNLKLSSMVELHARKTAAENQIADARRQLQSERDMAQRQNVELTTLADARSLNAQLTLVSDRHRQLITLQREREAVAGAYTQSRDTRTELKAQNDELSRKMKELKSRIVALSSVGAICPTCGRELAEEDRQRLLAAWNDQGRQWGDTYRAGVEQLRLLGDTVSAHEGRIAEIEKSLASLPAVQREMAALEERIARSNEAAASLPEVQADLERLDARLEAQDYAPEAQAALAQVTRELAELGYNADEHRRVRDELIPHLKGFVEKKNQLDRAEIGIESEQRTIESLNMREEVLLQRQEQEAAALSQLGSALLQCEKALQQAPQIDAAVNRARQDFFAAQRKVGEANQRVQSCHALEGKRDSLVNEINGLNKQRSLLGELRIAFGRNGVPAMIIEAILPELEETARDLLGRMTNERMSVRFETQRQTQKGDVSETLELRISDELGERPYELFSGGEAFRINFAVRVALSKLLANRAGARLQTLFIDEGFGTQDAQGRERLVEAIRSIQDEFELIVVITHIDELRDAFPARIDVKKALNGSVARVV